MQQRDTLAEFRKRAAALGSALSAPPPVGVAALHSLKSGARQRLQGDEQSLRHRPSVARLQSPSDEEATSLFAEWLANRWRVEG